MQRFRSGNQAAASARAGSLRRLAGQLSMFSVVGVVATAAHYAIMGLLIEAFGMPATPATAIGFLISAVGNYALNYKFTFASDVAHRRALPRFLVIATVGLALNAAIVAVLTGPMKLHWVVAQALATLTVLCWNFAANRRWTFLARVARGN